MQMIHAGLFIKLLFVVCIIMAIMFELNRYKLANRVTEQINSIIIDAESRGISPLK
jgi:hypothetical protein